MEDPSLALKLFVYGSWIASSLSMVLAFAVRTSRGLTRRLQSIPISPWSFATSVLAVGTYLLVLSQEVSGIVKYDGTVPFIDSILITIRMFGAYGGSNIQADVLAKYFTNESLYHAYEYTHSLARLAAPVDTLMNIFMLVSSFVSTPLLRLKSRKRDTFVFSKLTEQSLNIATSIKSHYERGSHAGESERCLIAFASVPSADSKGGSGQGSALVERALTRQMLCLSQSTSSVIDGLKRAQCRKVFVLSNTDELANLQEGISFVKQLCADAETHKDLGRSGRILTYVISTAVNADIFIDEMSATVASQARANKMAPISIRRIDQLRSTIESYLWNYPLFLVEKPDPTHIPKESDPLYTKTRRRIAIIGSGSVGCEFLKAAVWCSQMDDIDFTLDIIGSGDIRERMAMDCPEICRLNGEGPESTYHINFLSLDVNKGEYLRYLHDNRDELTYLIIALGDDLQNSKVARRTREILEQGRFDLDKAPDRVDRPLICAVIGDKSLATAVENLTTGKGAPYDILPIGVDSDNYSYDNLFMPTLDLMGQNVNRAYWGCYDLDDPLSDEACELRRQADASYDLFEYNRRSSRATAVHLKYNLFSYLRRQVVSGQTGLEAPQIPTKLWQGRLSKLVAQGADDTQGMTPQALVDQFQEYVDHASPEELRWLSVMEHNRWNAYMRTEGYEVADEQTFLSFNSLTSENQNRLSRQHVCLVPFDELPTTSDFVYPITHKESDRDYLRLDEVIVHHLKQIAEDHTLS